MAVLMLVSARGYAQTTYTRITSASDLVDGQQYIIVGYDEALGYCAMSYQKASNRHAVQVTEDGGSITVTPATDPNSQTEVFELTLGGSTGAWTFYDPLKDGYLYAASSSNNQLKTQTTLDDNGKWAIDFNPDGTAVVVAQGENTRNYMRFNENSSNGSPLFNCYKVDATIQVPVALYKAGGTAQPDPEPSNYPTGFVASVDGVDVTLTWTDATGSQLPHKYLVIGSKGSITVPVDGNPVPNGDLVMNVSYGVQTVSFSGLDGNSTYHFAIFPYTNSGSNIDYKTDGNYPTANAHTADLTYLLNENFENGELGVFTAYDMYGDQSWHNATYSGNSYAYVNGFASGSAHANEDWLISPVMHGWYQTITLQFMTAKNYTGNDLQLMISTDYDGVSEPTDFEWEELTDMFDWSTTGYEWVESGEVNITNYTGQHFYIAFVYTSSDEVAAAWQVDNVKVVAQGLLSVADNVGENFMVSPNPANDNIRFELAGQAQVSVYDLSGRMVSGSRMGAGVATLGVADLESGVYFLSVRYANGKKEVARFVKL